MFGGARHCIIAFGVIIFNRLSTISVRAEDGAVLEAEVHWYEGHGIGKKEIKIKKYL